MKPVLTRIKDSFPYVINFTSLKYLFDGIHMGTPMTEVRGLGSYHMSANWS